MVDINKIFDLHNKVNEIERHRKLLERLDRTNISEFDRQRNLINELGRNSTRDLHNPTQDLRNHLRDLQNPINELRNPFKDIDKSFKFLDDLRVSEKSINKSLLENLRDFQSPSIQIAKKLIEETFSPFSRNNLISERIKNDFEQLRESLLSPFHSRNSYLLRGFEQATKATTLSSVKAFSKTFLDKNLLRDENLLRQISNSLLSYDRFANNTLAILNLNEDKSIASALKGSLTLASEQMLRSTSLTQSFTENLDVVNFDKSNLFFGKDFPKENRYRVQKRELLRYDDVEEDELYESLVDKSVSATIFEQVVDCMLLLGQCNEASETIVGEKIFKLTSTSWSSAWILQKQVATNKESLRTIVESLYFIFYEGAGSSNLRFLTKGYLTDEEAKIMFVIKHLRNKWLSHDVEHGDASSIKRDYRQRKEALEWLGFERMPIKADDFIMLNSYLISELNKFLALLLERVSVFSKE